MRLLLVLFLFNFARGAPPGTCQRRCSHPQCVNPTPYAFYRNAEEAEVPDRSTRFETRRSQTRGRAEVPDRSTRLETTRGRTRGRTWAREPMVPVDTTNKNKNKLELDQKFGFFPPYNPYGPYGSYAYPFRPYPYYGLPPSAYGPPPPLCTPGTTCGCDSGCTKKGNCCADYMAACHPFAPQTFPFITAYLIFDQRQSNRRRSSKFIYFNRMCPSSLQEMKAHLCKRLGESDIVPSGGKITSCTLVELDEDLEACTQYTIGPLGDEQFYYELEAKVQCSTENCVKTVKSAFIQMDAVADKLVEEARLLAGGVLKDGETMPPINNVYIEGTSALDTYCNISHSTTSQCTDEALGACRICQHRPGEQPPQATLIAQGMDQCPQYPVEQTMQGPDSPNLEQVALEEKAKAIPKLIPLTVINLIDKSAAANPGEIFYGNPGIIRGTAGELMKNTGIWPPSTLDKYSQPGIQSACYNIARTTANIPNWGPKIEQCKANAKSYLAEWTEILKSQACPNPVSFDSLSAVYDCLTLTSGMETFCSQLTGCVPFIDTEAPTSAPTTMNGNTSSPTIFSNSQTQTSLENFANNQTAQEALDMIDFFQTIVTDDSQKDQISLNFCKFANVDNPCSCGVMMCKESCMYGEGLNCYPYRAFDNIPDNCYFLGCENNLPGNCRNSWDNSNFSMLTNDEIAGPNTPLKACRSEVKALTTKYSDADVNPHDFDQAMVCRNISMSQATSYYPLFKYVGCNPLPLDQMSQVISCSGLAHAVENICDKLEKCLQNGSPDKRSKPPRTITATLKFRVCERQKEQVQRFWPKKLAPTTPLLANLPADSETGWGTCVSNSGWNGDRFGYNRCDGEHKGVMRVGGREIVVCCQGEKVNPFNDGNLGYFGFMPPAPHGSQAASGFAGKRGYKGIPGVECDGKGCTYYPTCGCPVSIPALNVRVTGPRVNLPILHIPHGQRCATGADCASFHGEQGGIYSPKPENDDLVRITIDPTVETGGKLELYNTFIGNPDSIHIGDNVVLEKWSWTKAWTRNLHDYEWSVRSPPEQPFNPFDMQKIEIKPYIAEDAYLRQQPMFIGSPGNVWVGSGSEATAIKGSSESEFVRRIKEITTLVSNQNFPNY